MAEKKVIRMQADFPTEKPLDQAIRRQNNELKKEMEVENLPIIFLTTSGGEIIGEIELKQTKDRKGNATLKSSVDDVVEAMRVLLAEHEAMEAEKAKESAESTAEKETGDGAGKTTASPTPDSDQEDSS